MSRELDTRDFTVDRAEPARRAELEERAEAASARLPGEQRVVVAEVDRVTGNTSRLLSVEAAAADSDGVEPSDSVRRALDHLDEVQPALGLTDEPRQEFVADSRPMITSSGAHAVHLTQAYLGIGIFQTALTVRFAPDGRIVDTAGTVVDVATDVSPHPVITAQEAVLCAAEHVAAPHEDELGQVDAFGEPIVYPTVDLTGWQPEIQEGPSPDPREVTLFAPGPFGAPTRCERTWFPQDADTLRLGYDIWVTLPEAVGQYDVVVDAGDGQILYAHQAMKFALARGNVFRTDPRTTRVTVDFPFPTSNFPLGPPAPPALPPGFPEDWVTVDRTVGNSTNAHQMAAGPSLQGVTLPGGTINFDPSPSTGTDQQTLNIFYYCCVMHDICYALGFREVDGNFQNDNFGRGALAGDSVDARAWPGSVIGTANMLTPPDGTSPIMNMGLVSSTGRHTAFDSSIVYHEFTHGLNNRLVGGGAVARPLDPPQSDGMDEGWSDYMACTLNNATVLGDFVLNNTGGIRGFRYDSMFPDDFAQLGTGRYDGAAPHPIGEIWCATLMEIGRRVDPKLALQLVVDGLKLTPANPSFLQARDAILTALNNALTAGRIDGSKHAATLQGMWAVFARFGMGPRAASNGPQLAGIFPDYDLPWEPVSADSWAANRLDVFGVGADSSSQHKWWGGRGWGPSPTAWEPLGGFITSPPVYVSWGPDRLDGFVMGNDRGLWHQAWDGRSWSGWETMHGGEMRSKPAAVCWGPNRIDLFAVGRNRDLQHTWWDGSRWGGWESLGGVLTSPPTVVSWGTNRLDVFAQGTDGALWHRWWDGRAWGGWESLGGSIVGQPEAVCWGPNRIDVFAVGAGADLQHLWYENRWGPWESLNGVLRSAPTPVSWGPNRLDVFAIGTDRALWHRWWDGRMWGGWQPLGGGPLASRAAAVSWGPGRLDVFARRATDLALGHLWYENRWGPWESLGGVLLSG